jgi:hypothetical protein
MALILLDIVSSARRFCLPETEEQNTEENRQNPNAHGLGLLENLDNAVQEGGDPKEPFEQSSQHEKADDGNVNNLQLSVYAHPLQASESLTSLTGQGSVMSGMEPSVARAKTPMTSCHTIAND